MTINLLHPGHGKAQGRPHIELPKLKDLPAPVPAATSFTTPSTPLGEPSDRLPTGQLQAGTATAKALARKGGLAKAEKARAKLKLLDCLGLVDIPADVSLHPYLIAAEEFALRECERLAIDVGGGVCPPN